MTPADQIPVEKGEHVVAGAIDDNMLYPLLVWAWSLSESAVKPFRIVIGFLEDELSAKNRTIIGEVLDVLSIRHELVELKKDTRFIAQGHISPTTFTKFLLADLIAGPHVWIDVDAVAKPGWDEIFQEMAAVPASVYLVVVDRGKGVSTQASGIESPSNLAFNAGVLGWPGKKRKDWSKQLDSVGLVDTQEQFLFNKLYGSHSHKVSESFNTLTYRYDSFSRLDKPRITHYAGAHKPWHLPRRFSQLCLNHRCPWSLWFVSESAFLEAISEEPVRDTVAQEQKRALGVTRLSLNRGQTGLALLRVLRSIGQLGWLIIFASKPFKRWIPRGTHPLH